MSKKMKRNLIIISAVVLAIVIAIVLILVIPKSGSGSADENSSKSSFDGGLDMRPQILENGLHDVVINTNDKGEIENNSYGTLLPDYVPSGIEKLSIKSSEGNYTFLVNTPVNEDGTTEATVYTLEGFEDYDIATTPPSLIASAICELNFTQVADLGGKNEADYGFDNPRVEATVYFNDGTHAIVRLGDDAPTSEFCYIQYGDSKTVYIVLKEEIAPLLFSFTELFSTSLNSDKTSVADDSFDKIILGGTHLDREVTILANTDISMNCYYVDGNKMPINTNECSAIMGAIKALTADSVVCVNPDDAQLESYGLKTPFATVKTNYLSPGGYDAQGNPIPTDEIQLSVSLTASQKDSEGMVYMMEENGKIVYRIPADSVPWATTTADKLKYEYVLSSYYMALGAMEIEANGKVYDFLLSSEEVPYVDDNGNEASYMEPVAYLDGKLLDAGQFSIFYQDLMFMKVAGTDSSGATDKEAMKITYTYVTDREQDTVSLYYTDTQKVIPVVNSQESGYVYRADVTALIKNLENLASGKEIASVYSE